MGKYISALKFVIASLREASQVPGPSYDTPLKLADGSEKPLDVYLPGKRSRPLGTILVIHGMSPRGYRDPRIISVCRSLATAGFRVLATHFPEIANLKIDPLTAPHIQETVDAICNRPDICPRRRLSIFTASFSAGMALIVAAKEESASRIRALCTIGTLSSMESTTRYLLGQPEMDIYGTMICLANFVKYSVGNKKKLIQAFHLTALDNSFQPGAPQLPAHLETLSAADQKLYERFFNEAEFRLEHFEIMKEPVLKDFEDFKLLKYPDHLQAAVTLIHGQDDKVIPASESEILYNRLQKLGIESRLDITPLISHGDHTFTPAQIPSIFSFIGSMAHFFKNARDPG